MLPLSIQVPASIVLLAGGAMACFAGYRLFRLVLGVYGFILGALVASSMVGASGTWTIVLAALGRRRASAPSCSSPATSWAWRSSARASARWSSTSPGSPSAATRTGPSCSSSRPSARLSPCRSSAT